MHGFLFVSAVLLASCSSSPTPTGTEPEEPEEPEGPPVAFTDREVQELFDTKCVRCHTGATTVLELRDFKSHTIDVPASTSGKAKCADSETPTRIVAGDRQASLIWHKVKGTQDCGDPMPPPSRGSKLTATELERLGLYIDGLSTE
jgi:hypothetical protein